MNGMKLKDATLAAELLGVSPVDKDGNLRNFSDVVEDFGKALIDYQNAERPKFDADAAENYITDLCIDARKSKEEVFRKDNFGRDRFDFVYSDQYYMRLGEELAYRKVLEYFAKFDF